jgi:hypothetical protein
MSRKKNRNLYDPTIIAYSDSTSIVLPVRTIDARDDLCLDNNNNNNNNKLSDGIWLTTHGDQHDATAFYDGDRNEKGEHITSTDENGDDDDDSNVLSISMMAGRGGTGGFPFFFSARQAKYVCQTHCKLVIILVVAAVIILVTSTTAMMAQKNDDAPSYSTTTTMDGQDQDASSSPTAMAVEQACHQPDSLTEICEATCAIAKCCFEDTFQQQQDDCESIVPLLPAQFCQEYAGCQTVFGSLMMNDGHGQINEDDDNDDDLTTLPSLIEQLCSQQETQDHCLALCKPGWCCFVACGDTTTAAIDESMTLVDETVCEQYSGCEGVFAGQIIPGTDDGTSSPNDPIIMLYDDDSPGTSTSTSSNNNDDQSPTAWNQGFGLINPTSEPTMLPIQDVLDTIQEQEGLILATTVPASVTSDIPPAPANLELICSASELATIEGLKACHHLCIPYDCCWDPYAKESCVDDTNCIGYRQCAYILGRDGDIGFTSPATDDVYESDSSLTTTNTEDDDDASSSPPNDCADSSNQVLWPAGTACGEFAVCFTQHGKADDANDQQENSSTPYIWAGNQGAGFYLSRMSGDDPSSSSVILESSYYYYEGDDSMQFHVDIVSGLVIESFSGAFGVKINPGSRGLSGTFDDGPSLYVVKKGTMKSSVLNGVWTILNYQGGGEEQLPIDICRFLAM